MAKKKSVKAAYIAEQSRKRARSESTSSEHTSDSGREQKTGSPITSGSPSVDGAKKKRKLKGKSTIALFQLLLESSNRVVVLLSFSLSNKYSGGCTFFSLLLFPKQPPRNSTAAVRHGQRNTPRKKEEKKRTHLQLHPLCPPSQTHNFFFSNSIQLSTAVHFFIFPPPQNRACTSAPTVLQNHRMQELRVCGTT